MTEREIGPDVTPLLRSRSLAVRGAAFSAAGRTLVLIVMAASIPILLFAGWMSLQAASAERAAARAAACEVVERTVERVTAELTAQKQVAATLALSASLDEPDLSKLTMLLDSPGEHT